MGAKIWTGVSLLKYSPRTALHFSCWKQLTNTVRNACNIYLCSRDVRSPLPTKTVQEVASPWQAL